MKDFETFRVETWHCPKYGVRMMFHAEVGASRADRPPMSRIWFYLYLNEFLPAWQRGGWPLAVADGFHKAEICGDTWTFYDWETPTGLSGVREVPFRNVEMPRRAVDVLMRWCRLRCRSLPPDTRVEIEIPREFRARLCTRYGQGRGTARVVIDDTNARVVERYQGAIGDPSFEKQLGRLKQIAINTTTTKWQEASVLLTYDFAGFYFTVYTPDNKRSMHGGLIHHQPGHESYAVELCPSEGAHWSIHT